MKIQTILLLTLAALCQGLFSPRAIAFERNKEVNQGERGRPEKIPSFNVEIHSISLVKEGSKQTLYNLDGKPVLLSDTWKGKPVLLVTSSLTCPISRDNCPAVDNIQKKFGDKINVVIIYTTEAHPKGSPSPYSEREWLTRRNVHDQILVDQPTTLSARIARAKKYKEKMHIQSTILVDNMKNSTWKLLGGGPNSALFVSFRDSKQKIPYLSARQGWLSPYTMENNIRDHFDSILNEKVWKSLKSNGYSRWSFSEFFLSEKLDEIKAKLDKHPDWVHARVSYDRVQSKQQTLLHLAVKEKLPRHLELFIKRGLSVNVINYRGETPLHIAATTDLKMVEQLLKHDANVNVYRQGGLTPLHDALLENKIKIAKKLIAHGARVDLKAAAALGDKRTVNRFLSLYKIDTFKLQKIGGGALAFAASRGQTAIVKQLLNAGAMVNLKTDGRSPLYYAVDVDHSEIIQLLLESKADVEGSTGPTDFSHRLIHHAVLYNKTNALKLLLKNGVDPDTLSYNSAETPLHVAAILNHLKAVKILLKHGASIDALSGSPRSLPCGPPNFDSRPVLQTAVHFAAREGHTEILRFLIKRGAKVNLKNRDGATPLDFARNQKEVIKILLAANAKAGSPEKRNTTQSNKEQNNKAQSNKKSLPILNSSSNPTTLPPTRHRKKDSTPSGDPFATP